MTDGRITEAQLAAAFFAARGHGVILSDEVLRDIIVAARRAGLIPNGSVAQYRKVGKGTVRFHECPAERPCEGETIHRYLVHFTTGRYRGTSRQVWLRQGDMIEAAS